MSVVQRLPVGQGFVEVADRVYVARYSAFDVNVGLIVGDRGAVVIDTRAGVAQGREVVDDVRHAAPGADITTVVYTHVHYDHTLGARAFDPVEVVAHENLVEALPAHAADVAARIRADARSADPAHAEALHAIAEAADDPRMPDRTFSSLGFVDLGDRVVELAFPGLGHSSSDITIAVPDASLVFVGDLVEESGPPSFGDDCHPLDWSATLDTVVGMSRPDTTVVPGHGNVVDRAFVEQTRSDIGSVAQGLADAYAAGVEPQDVLNTTQQEWPYPIEHLETAVRRTFEELERRAHPRHGATPPPGAGTLPLA